MLSPTFRLAFGILGNIVSLFLYLSPVPTFVHICKKGSVEEFSSTNYVMTFFNCMCWTAYGMPFITHDNILLSTVNGLGSLLEFVYLLLFIIYAKNNRKRIILFLIMVIEMVAIGVTMALLLILTHSIKIRSLVIGLLGDVCTVAMYASPLAIMRQVIKTKSLEFMPLVVSVASLSNAIVWTLYSIQPLELFVMVPNGLGCILGLIQVIFYAVYR